MHVCCHIYHTYITPLRLTPHYTPHYVNQALELLKQLEPEDERHKEIPPNYHSVWPLDDGAKSQQATGSFGYPSSVFKVRIYVYVWCGVWCVG